jgi:hypothetical protein
MRQWPKSHHRMEDVVHSRRRLITAAAVAVMALIGLTACRSAPGIAAYVGDTTYTDTYVDGLVTSFQADTAANARTTTLASLQEQVKSGQITQDAANAEADKAAANAEAQISKQFGDLRRTAVQFLVVRDAVNQYAKKHDITVKPADVGAVAAAQNLPPNSELVKVYAEYRAAMDAVSTAAKPAKATHEDRLEAYKNLVEAYPGVPPFEQVEAAFSDDLMGTPVGVRNLLAEILSSAKTSVSPRYSVLDITVPVQLDQSTTTHLSIPLAGGSGAVEEAPSPAATELPAQ